LPRKKRWIWCAIFSLTLLVGAYWFTPISRALNKTASVFLYPLLKSYQFMVMRVNGTSYWFKSQRVLQKRVVELEQEHKKFVEEITALQGLIHYYEDIHELAAFRNRYKKLAQARIVQVLLVHCTAHEQYILVEGGVHTHDREGMLAIVNNHLIGRVAEIFPYYSKVLLITDKRTNVAGYCARTRTRGIVVGTNSEHMKFKFVDHMKRLHKGDMVLSSGQGLLYPQGLCIGKIIDFVKKDVDYDVTIAPLIDLSNIAYCFILHSSQMR